MNPHPVSTYTDQIELDLGEASDLDSHVEPFPVGVLTTGQPSAITGVVMCLEDYGRTIQFRWANTGVAFDAAAPLAFANGDREADIWVDDVMVGRATILQTICALIEPCGQLAGFVDASTVLFGGLPGAFFPQRRQLIKERAIATLAGPMAPVLALLQKQGLISVLARESWRRLLAAFKRLSSAGGMDEYFVLTWTGRKPPGRKLTNRLASISDQRLTALFVQIAVAMGVRERQLFDQAVSRGLKSLSIRLHAPASPAPHGLVRRACIHVFQAADRHSYIQSASGNGFPTAALADLRFSGHAGSLKRPHPNHPVTPGIRSALLAWVRRCEVEFTKRGLTSVAELEKFEQECNVILDVLVQSWRWGWTTSDLACRPWRELKETVWIVPPRELELVDTTWEAPVPPGSAEALRDVGLKLKALANTDDVRAEARQQRSCLASSNKYIRRMSMGDSRLFAIKGAGIRATLEFQRDGEDGWGLAEILGPRNSPLPGFVEATSAQWCAIRAFVERVESMGERVLDRFSEGATWLSPR